MDSKEQPEYPKLIDNINSLAQELGWSKTQLLIKASREIPVDAAFLHLICNDNQYMVSVLQDVVEIGKSYLNKQAISEDPEILFAIGYKNAVERHQISLNATQSSVLLKIARETEYLFEKAVCIRIEDLRLELKLKSKIQVTHSLGVLEGKNFIIKGKNKAENTYALSKALKEIILPDQTAI